jgi:GNAT superfamily N-acetyltransferase
MGHSARELDLLGARAWPPVETLLLGDWRLRFAGGVTKRANSVLPLGPEESPVVASATLTASVLAVEDAYAERGLPAIFQITASSWPPQLSDVLSSRGYEESDPTLVMTARLPTEAHHTLEESECEIVEHEQPSRDWLDAWWMVDGRGGARELEMARTILSRIEQPCLFAESHDREGIASVALGVIDGDWVGLYCLATLPRARRRGCARGLIRHLTARARALGAERAHLAVMEANEPSQQLCRSLDFEPQQRYSYFTRR